MSVAARIKVPQSLLLLCQLLSPFTDEAAVKPLCTGHDSHRIDWEAVAFLANCANLAPALYSAVFAKGVQNLLPEQFLEYLEAMHQLNLERNAAILGQLKEIIATLASAGIPAMPLKGGAALLTGLYGNLGDRFMMDIDLLVPESRADEAVALLLTEGYIVPDSYVEMVALWKNGKAKHYAPLVREGMPVHLELHRDLFEVRDLQLLASRDVWQTCAMGESDGLSFAAMSPSHQLLHCILHSEISHENYKLRMLDLKQMLHFAWLCRRYGTSADWREIEKFCRDNGILLPVNAFLFATGELFGVDTPLTPKDDAEVSRHFAKLVSFDVSGRKSRLEGGKRLLAHTLDAFSADGVKLRFPLEQSSPPWQLRLKLIVLLLHRYGSIGRFAGYLKRQRRALT